MFSTFPALTAQQWQDLRWLASGPDLMELTAPCSLLLPPSGSALSLVFPSTRPLHRVGHYVERLVGHWLAITPGLSEIEQGIVIRDGKRTVGELDFLFRHEGRLHHLEVALKFYLHSPVPGHESCAEFSHFPGPNATDNFEKKRDKLLFHQLPLGRSTFPEVAASHALVKGLVFYRPGEAAPSALPESMNPAHLRGTWIRSTEIDRLLEEPWARDCRGRVMEKPHWLSGWTAASGEELQPMRALHGQLRSHFSGYNRPVLLSLVQEGQAHECERLIVVPADWPTHHD
jgi:uncharacterized protein